MKRELGYTDIVIQLIEYKLNYITLLYSNALLHNHLSDSKLQNCLKNNSFELTHSRENPKDSFILSSERIIKHLETYNKISTPINPESFNATCERVLMMNSHFLRTRILNGFFETISHYYKNSEKWKELHTYHWFQILYILRNNASHFDNYNKTIKFPKWKWLKTPYPDIVEWGGIKVSNGQLGHEIRYNDKQLLLLIKTIIEYFIENRERIK